MKQLAWLHLSDWHQKGPDFDRGVVRDALIKDIRERERIDRALARVDFIVFSGDLAFSGKPAEYEAAQQHLLHPLLNATRLEPNRLFIVPGNHDLSRETIYEMLPTELQRPLDSDALVQKWLDDTRRARTLEPFEAYRSFVSQYTGQPTPDYASIVRLDAGGKPVALLGLNSAWMTARNKDAQGEVNDYGYTLIGEPQFHDALAQIADAELRIAVVHHPFDWLKEFDRNRIEARLGRECHFILRGHVHTPQVQVMRGTEGDCVIIPAGASYDRRVAENPRYINAYNWVHLDFEARRGTIYLRRWSDQRNEWVEDIDSRPGGKFVLDNLPKELGKQPDIIFRPPVPLNGPLPLPSAGQTFRDRLKTGADGPLMMVIPAGRFQMGSPADEPERFDNEGPQHDVDIAAPFAMGVYTATFEDYERFCEDTLRKSEDSGWGRETRPVINVSCEDARDYCAWLGEQTGRAYRLPSEAEWEYACRAGTDTPFHFGPHITTDQANFNGTKGSVEGEYRQRTVPVGSFPPNSFGLYDMHGNVWEWCQDQRHNSYEGAPSDGSAWEGEEKGFGVVRGGSWDGEARYCRAACRLYAPPRRRHYGIGFRVCCADPIE